MVCTAKDLQEWKNFPKGLRILLLDGDSNSAAEIRSKLEAMDYIVSTFCNENEALSAISSKPEGFHVAIVEVSTSSSQGSYKFLENAKELPTIMTSNNHCLKTMMKCIALGAVEFLSKPLSEDKLRNIWQHVVHKAFSAGANIPSESLKPVKESVESMLQLQADNGNRMPIDIDKVSKFSDNDHEQSVGSDKYPAPSTPQLKQGARLLDDGDCQEQADCSTDKESGGLEGESKSVETTCGTANAEDTLNLRKPENTLIKQEADFADGSKSESTVSPNPCSRKVLSNIDGSHAASPNKARVSSDSCDVKVNRKKMKVDWTPELHKKFLQAVEQLGDDQAIPSRILKLMKVDDLTRHNVASHLQKYRMHKRLILPKEEDRKWPQQRGPMQSGYFLQKPITAFPSYHFNQTISPAPLYPPWGQSGVQMWGPPCYPAWQPTESWHGKSLPGMQADAWGCPVLPPTQAHCFSFSQNYRSSGPRSSIELHPEEEVIDRVVKEATSKPWLPLPLGLKSPSLDSVLAELSMQGMSRIPPGSSNKGSKPR